MLSRIDVMLCMGERWGEEGRWGGDKRREGGKCK